MSHRFCLIAPGDWVSTHKVSEAMAIGGAGGCIPIFVLPGNSVAAMQHAAPGMLPYTRWHDFCDTAYFVREKDARTRLIALLDKFDSLPEDNHASKRAFLRSVRNAFVVRDTATFSKPTAPDFILGDACALAAAHSRAQWTEATHKQAWKRVSATDITRCLVE